MSAGQYLLPGRIVLQQIIFVNVIFNTYLAPADSHSGQPLSEWCESGSDVPREPAAGKSGCGADVHMGSILPGSTTTPVQKHLALFYEPTIIGRDGAWCHKSFISSVTPVRIKIGFINILFNLLPLVHLLRWVQR